MVLSFEYHVNHIIISNQIILTGNCVVSFNSKMTDILYFQQIQLSMAITQKLDGSDSRVPR